VVAGTSTFRSCADRAPNTRVGIDLALKALATLSDEREIAIPQFYRKNEAKLATVQRARKAPKRVRNIHAKIANRRKDFLHKRSAEIVKEYGLIVVGDVSPSKLAKTRMAKGVLDAGWADLKRMLSYKAITHGGMCLEVSAVVCRLRGRKVSQTLESEDGLAVIAARYTLAM
jgi:putative transposase